MIDLKDLEARSKHDGLAAFALAEARIMGVGCERDQKAAFRAVQQSARLGNEHGRRAEIYMTASGTGRKPDYDEALSMLAKLAKEDRLAAVQLAFLEHLTCERRLAEVKPTVVSEDPYIAVFPQLFSAAECHYLVILGTPWLKPATVFDSAGQSTRHPIRDADSATLAILAEDMVVQAINRCIAAATGTQPGWGEPLTILRYAPGQQYRPHFDASGPDKNEKRRCTALIWLNDQFEGGETHFPELKITVRGGIGDLLVFNNLTAAGDQDPRMLHAGLPVTRGTKWLASRWIRSKNYLK